MKKMDFLLFTLCFLIGSAVSANAERFVGGIGGFPTDPACYQGNYIKNVLCNEHNATTQLGQLQLRANAQVRVIDSQVPNYSTTTAIKLTMTVDDQENFFQPESQVPVLVRAIKVGFHRRNGYSVESYPMVFTRTIYGTRQLSAELTIITDSVSGSEYVQVLNKLEVLLPGQAGVAVLDFSDFRDS